MKDHEGVWSGKLAVITGGGQGIGRAIAEHFLAAGASAAILEIDPEAGEEARAELAEKHGPASILFVPTDAADEASVRSAMAAAKERFGRIDVLVNNAAISRNIALAELSYQEWKRVLDVNLGSVFLCAKYAAPELKAARGAVVNLASTRAFMSEPNTEAYSASKGGVAALTHALAVSLGPEVRVNAVAPGWIDCTPHKKLKQRRPAVLSPADHAQHPAGRVGTPSDIARLVLFLADPANSFITGQTFIADGGMTRRMIYV